jgi:MFS transporter, SP family, sugar:H+ symporter
MITTIVNVASTPLSFYTIERFGRRPLLIYGGIAMCICEMIIAIVGTLLPNSNAANYSMITFVCIYVFFFAGTWGPAAWVVIGEIYQLPMRSKGVALSTASNWFWNCIIAIIVPYMVDGHNDDNATDQTRTGGLGVKVFFVWGALCFTCAIFAYAVVPETKGLTLEQVDRMMEEVSARRSGRWLPRENWARDLSAPVGSPESIPMEHKSLR